MKTTIKRTTPAPVHDDDEADGAGGHAWRLNDDVVDEVQSVVRRSETTTTRTAPVATHALTLPRLETTTGRAAPVASHALAYIYV